MYIPNNIRFLRKQKGMTQGQLGQLFGVTDSQITNYEKGKSSPPVDVVHKMSVYFEIDLNSFFNVDLENSDIKFNSENNASVKSEFKSPLVKKVEHPSLTERLNFLEKEVAELKKRIGS